MYEYRSYRATLLEKSYRSTLLEKIGKKLKLQWNNLETLKWKYFNSWIIGPNDLKHENSSFHFWKT